MASASAETNKLTAAIVTIYAQALRVFIAYSFDNNKQDILLAHKTTLELQCVQQALDQ